MAGMKRERGRKRVGRPRLPLEEARRNRVVIMLADADLAKLDRMAEQQNLPLGTVAHEIVTRALSRKR